MPKTRRGGIEYVILFTLISLVMIVGLLLIATRTIDVTTFALAVEEPKPDNTALWTALIASLVLNVLNFLSSTIGNVLQFWLKMAQIKTDVKITRTEKKVDENTVLTRETKKAVNGDKAKEKEESYESGYRDAQHGREKTPTPR